MALVEPGLRVVTADTAELARPEARARIRAALCAMVAAAVDVDAEAVSIATQAGRAPVLSIKGRVSRQGVSITHAGQFACAAWHAHGPVGIDVQPVLQVPEMARLALEYLGPEVHAALDALAPPARSVFFAQAWARREAHLKCLGLPLAEFAPLPGHCRLLALAVADGFAGALAVPQIRHESF